MKRDEVPERLSRARPTGAAKPYSKPYSKPQIIEWGSIVELTGNFLNGPSDPNFGVGGTVGGLRRVPPPPR